MILITGSKGKLGKIVSNTLVKNKLSIIETIKSKKFRLTNKGIVYLDLSNKNHLKKIFSKYKIKHLVHLAVTRNPMHIKEIRSYNTLISDTEMVINILKYCKKLKTITFTSSASVYALKDVKDFSKSHLIAKRIKNFILNKKRKKIQIQMIGNKRRKNLRINPLFHPNYNKRLNGSSKFINELILSSFCFEYKISLYILRPFYVIEDLKINSNKL